MDRRMDREAAAHAIEAFLKALGRDPSHDPELASTAHRVASAFADELLVGYGVDVDALLSQNVIPGQTDLVIVRDVPITTTCPHHLMPAVGTATVAFEPEEHIIGVGTIGRLVDAFALRLTLQEQIGHRVVAALQKHLAPRWVGCRLVLSHACMTARGDRKHGARVETIALAGGDIDEEVAYRVLGVGR
jgi:GTP cyclohydrolase I